MSALSDAVLLELMAMLTAKELAMLATTSKFLYAFTSYEDLWKAVVLEVAANE